jgi:hypothetical protein
MLVALFNGLKIFGILMKQVKNSILKQGKNHLTLFKIHVVIEKKQTIYIFLR